MVGDSIPRIARLMALAIGFEELLREKQFGIKLQTANKYFRFYFNIHRKKRILIVGDCGHLDTAGTPKRR